MIRVTCPGCGSTIGAKDELLGETRKCPKCGNQLVISPRASANAPAPADLGITQPTTDAAADGPGLGNKLCHGAAEVACRGGTQIPIVHVKRRVAARLQVRDINPDA